MVRLTLNVEAHLRPGHRMPLARPGYRSFAEPIGGEAWRRREARAGHTDRRYPMPRPRNARVPRNPDHARGEFIERASRHPFDRVRTPP